MGREGTILLLTCVCLNSGCVVLSSQAAHAREKGADLPPRHRRRRRPRSRTFACPPRWSRCTTTLNSSLSCTRATRMSSPFAATCPSPSSAFSPRTTSTLHANKLNILEGSVTFSATSSPAVTSSSPAVTSWEEDKERQFLVVHLDREMKVGERYTLSLNFTGPLKDDLHGLYLSSYERGNKTM